ncbi:MAG: ABC transporter ATP-binding protein [Saprospiraceae bacterium]|nr:ABC transporter ATP-binding protein [Saprospiraceae bacterium]
MAAIQVNRLSKSFDKGKIIALKAIDLSIQPGEVYGLIGPDGAGKTTLLRILASLLLPESGTAQVLGFDPAMEYQEVRKIIGYMPGRFSLYQDLSVEENLQFFATVFKSDIKKNYHLIKELYDQLVPFKDRRAGKLSGGMKQKLALCCALIHEPKVLLLDEPTTGVDPVSRREFWDMLMRLKQRGITIVVSTPYMDEAKLCDRISLMQLGSILETGTPQEIRKRSGKKLFAVDADEKYSSLVTIRAYPGTFSCYAFGDKHHVQLKSGAPEDLSAFLKSNGIQNFEIFEIEPDIEDIFMDKLSRLS